MPALAQPVRKVPEAHEIVSRLRADPRILPVALLAPAILVALAVRLPYFTATDFPLNDGGLFFVMSAEIAAAGYRLPAFTSYNFEQIPFAYPPLGFFLAAGLSDLLRQPLDGMLRVLPVAANLCTVGAFYLLARSVLGSWTTAAVAAGAFALLPRGFEWLVMGGGLTRSLGFLFALAALSQARALYERPTWRRLAVGVLLVAATVLSHLEMGLFAAYSFALFWLAYGRSVRAAGSALGLGVGVVLLTAPWWVVVVNHHTLAPFLAAGGTSGWDTTEESLRTLLTFTFTDERLFPLLAGLGALGLFPALLRGYFLLPAWLLVIFLGTPRSAPTEATVPLAILIGLALTEIILPGVAATVRRQTHRPGWLQWVWVRLQGPDTLTPLAFASVIGLIAGYALVLNWLTVSWDRHFLHAVAPEERAAMQWIASATPPSSQFLVISPAQSWEVDYIYEWFPALAQRRSALTVQGTEWLPGRAHGHRAMLYSLFKIRRVSSVADLEYWARADCVKFTHVYISKTAQGPLPTELLQASFASSSDYRLLLETDGAVVLGRVEPFPTRVGSYPVASDCRALVDEPSEVQAAYAEAFGERAPWVWLQQHELDLTQPRAVSS